MATNIRWWKDGDHPDVVTYKARAKADELCPECGAPYGIHGKLGAVLVHPGDHVVTNNKGEARVEHPDPMGEALKDMKAAEK